MNEALLKLKRRFSSSGRTIREFKKTTMATATATSLKKIGFMSGTMAVHVRYNFWYISLLYKTTT